MFELLKKDFEIEILEQKVEYKQLSYYDCLELHYRIQKDFDLYKWTYDFLKDKITITYDDVLKIDVKKLFDVYLDTACRWFYDKKWKWWKWVPFESFISFIAKEMRLDVITMLKTYTPEAFNYITDWIIYNLNEQTKEGQNRNKINQEIKSTPKQDKEKILKNVEYMDSLLNNK